MTPSFTVSVRVWPFSDFHVPLNFDRSCAINMNAETAIASMVMNIAFFKSVFSFQSKRTGGTPLLPHFKMAASTAKVTTRLRCPQVAGEEIACAR